MNGIHEVRGSIPLSSTNMATISLRMRDDLKRKARELAEREGVSLNGFVNATIAAAVAQEETLSFFNDRLKDVDLKQLHERVLRFMRKTQEGAEPTADDIRRSIRS